MRENAAAWTNSLFGEPKLEGEWSDREPAADPGGKTMRGITMPVLAEFLDRKVTEADLRKVTPELATQIAMTMFWGPARCDDMPGGVDIYLADFSFHSNWSQAVKVLQRVLGVDDDGRAGKLTLTAARAYDPEMLVRDLHDARLEFLAGLKNYPQNARGWRNRCNEVRRLALQHVQARPVLTAMVKSTDARVAAPMVVGNGLGLGWLWTQYGSQAADWIRSMAENEHVTGAAAALAQQPALPKIVAVVGILLLLSLLTNGVQLWRARQRYLKPQGI